MLFNYKGTMFAGFAGYVVQAIVNNFVPLLFVTLQNSYSIPLSQITVLITANFLIQLLVDLLSAGFVDKLGYRFCVVVAHVCSAAGLALLTVLPDVMPSAFAGILVAVCVYAVGGGLIEVLISPIIEACPTENKEKAMSLLHSFYCWGHVGVVLVSTLFFMTFKIENWKLLAILWALVPVCNGILFALVPLYKLGETGGSVASLRQLFSNRLFWLLMLMMVCAGASEQAVSQWASTFAERGLGVGKTAGDLAGPMAFAALMGASRLIFGKYGDKLNLDVFMQASCLLCVAAYLCIVFVPVPLVALVGCAVCGFSVGIMWPGTFSKAAASVRGGTAMFALLALGGDLGCGGGPTLVGFVSSHAGGNLKAGILAALVFPLVLFAGVSLLKKLRPSASQPRPE